MPPIVFQETEDMKDYEKITCHLFGRSVFLANLEQEPLFIDGNIISAERTDDPRVWNFSCSPLLCDVSDKDMDGLSLFLLHTNIHHSRVSYNERYEDVFPLLMKVFAIAVDKIKSHYEQRSWIEASNLMIIMTEILKRIGPVVKVKQSPVIIKKMLRVLIKLQKINRKKVMNQMIQLFCVTLINLRVELDLARELMIDLYLKKTRIFSTRSVKSSDVTLHFVKFSQYVPENNRFLVEISDNNDYSGPSVQLISYKYKLKPFAIDNPQIYKIEKGLSEKNSIFSAKWIYHYQRLVEMGIIMFVEKRDISRILFFFDKSFWLLRKRTDSDSRNILFQKHEVEFIYHFIIKAVSSLNIYLSGQSLATIISMSQFIKMLMNILNSLRYCEVIPHITNTIALSLVKETYELWQKSPKAHKLYYISLKLAYILEEFPAKTFLEFSYCARETYVFPQPLKLVASASDISFVRKNDWKLILSKGSTPVDCLERYQQRECPICYAELHKIDFSYLPCQHAFCTSCIIAHNKVNKSLKCAYCCEPFKEVILSRYITQIYQDLIPMCNQLNKHF